MDTILASFAGFGLLLIIIGRTLIVRRVQHIGKRWAVGFSLLPLAELMFLTRYWEETKVGAFTSLFGLALIMPWSGQMLWDAQHSKAKQHVQATAGSALAVGEKDQEISEEEKQQIRIECAEERIEAMNARLLGWYKEIQERRGEVGSDTEAVLTFNEEAKAYHQFFAIVREETNALEQMQAKSRTVEGKER